ncbi:MAG: DUF1648 domain-containing protein, partial [Halobacteriovoraceae bacterium]|nr:DUF1648 domain-containing protein [Halobacteriovoraceae bacterium]
MMAFKDLFNFKKNPKIELPWTKKEVWLLFIALLPLYFQFQEFYAAYQNMPSTIPIHFNLEGVVDGRAPKELLK